ncbi:G protein-activated inward rectifier potassium channel 3-like isoform X2 [Watersipora subatra]
MEAGGDSASADLEHHKSSGSVKTKHQQNGTVVQFHSSNGTRKSGAVPNKETTSITLNDNHRQKSSSEHNIFESSLKVPAEHRKRSGSLVSLSHQRPKYVAVEHLCDSIGIGERPLSNSSQDPDKFTSFADYVQVSRKKSTVSALGFKGPSKTMRRRLVYKNGECNVSHKHIRKVKRHYLADIFTTLIDLKWRWSLIIFVMTFTLTWLFFAMIWYIISFTHGDFDEVKTADPDHQPCIDAVTDFPTAFLFSLETQHTIGYGGRAVTSECPEAVIMIMIQSITGTLVQALMTGMIFAKLSRPKKRAETLMFSRKAAICLRDGALCLMFRIGDMRSSHLIEAHVRGMVVRRRVTREGEVLPLDHQDVNFGFDNGTDRLLIIWPVIVIHKIDKLSPFWRMSKADLDRENFELIIVLEGTIESTGMTTQARTSYLPGEILWGQRLERLVTFQKDDGEYQVDYSRFENTVAVDTPSMSAKELAAMHPDSDSNSEEEFTLLRADSIQTSETEEGDELLLPDNSTAIRMYDMHNGRNKK